MICLKVETYFSYLNKEFCVDMKYLAFSIFLIFSTQLMAQDNLLADKSCYSIYSFGPSAKLMTPNTDFLNFTKDVKIVSVNTFDSNFQRTYLVNKDGETISSGFMPSSYFLPNHNLIVISGKNIRGKDSFNPYGASDMTSAIIIGTFNNFISKLKINRR